MEAVRVPFEALLQASGGPDSTPLEGGWEGAKEAVDVALNALRQVGQACQGGWIY